jgi:hypothetical protein
MFRKNPNQYFYRHNEPGVEQWVHEWSEEERELFLEVKKKKILDNSSACFLDG